MTLLLDTHVLLWFLADDPQLVASAKERIEDASNRKLVSLATCWEIAIKAGLKKRDLGEAAAAGRSVSLAGPPVYNPGHPNRNDQGAGAAPGSVAPSRG